jgi:hypothetical protein
MEQKKPILTKICTKCGEEKDILSFSTNGKNGRHTSCKKCQAENARRKRRENPEKIRKQEREQYKRNPKIKKKSISKYYQKNKEKIKAKNKERYRKNAEKIKAQNAEYRNSNRDKVYEWNGSRRARIRKALPLWADRGKIREIYKEAKKLSEKTGTKHHVDHIIPLNHPKVSGLHVPENLQVIPWVENLKKNNRCNISQINNW